MTDRDWDELRKELKAGEVKMTVRELEPLLVHVAETAMATVVIAHLNDITQRLTDLERRVTALEGSQQRRLDRR